jgi:DNA-binding CsgD family transcriptional regulator/tetratricopeptide (TPR) repeat protein
VLLGGDAGVGKSRLITELATQAKAAQWRVLVGHCLDFGESALSYLAFSEALGRLALDEAAMAASLVESNPAIFSLLPSHRMLTETPDRERTMDRVSLLEAIHSTLTQLGRDAPLMLVVEDLHWADRSTRELLTFLFTRGFASQVTIVASYRSDDLHRAHPLRSTLTTWARIAGVTRLQVSPLEDPQMRLLIESLNPSALPEAETQKLLDRAEGNPFYLEELLAAVQSGGSQLPSDLADLMLLRLDQLDDAARLVVRAAAVVGRRSAHRLLARGSGLDGEMLDRALRHAVEANVLLASDRDTYSFRHALLAEAVYQDLLPGERTRLHAACASALASGEVMGTAAELARHALASHDLVTGAKASLRAGDEAMAVGGPDEATRHYERALELTSDHSVAAALRDGGGDIVDLAVRACAAAVAAGDSFRAIALAEDQLHSLPDDAAPQHRARLLSALAVAALPTDSKVDVLAITTEAVGLLSGDSPSLLQAEILAVHARAHADRARYDEAARWADDALHMARQLGLPDVAADAATTLANVEKRTGDPDETAAALLRAVAEAEAAGDVASELRALFSLGGLYYERGRLSPALDVYRRTWQRAKDAGRPWAPFGLEARAETAIVALVAGDWNLAAEACDVSGESPPAFAEALLRAIGLEIAAKVGDDQDALELEGTLRHWWERDGLVAIIAGGAGIELRGQRGDLEGARAIYDEVVEAVIGLWRNPAFAARIRLAALLIAELASGAVHAGAVERAELGKLGEEIVVAARPAVDAFTASRHPGPEGEAWVARLQAEHGRLRWLTGVDPLAEDELVERWRRAVRAFETFGHSYEIARSQARLAAVLGAAGRHDEAHAEIVRSRAAALRLGARPLAGELRALDAQEKPVAQGVPSHDPTLTPRETEVLKLVAEGRSNREIGLQLFISIKTVSVHVSNILAKLGAASRTEAVALARRRGLLGEGPGQASRR